MKILTCIFSMITLVASAQNSESHISIDNELSQELDSLVKINEIGGTVFGELKFHVRNIEDAEELIVENASDLFFFLDMQELLNEKFVGTTCTCGFRNDTIKISGGQGYWGGIGFTFLISNDHTLGDVWLQTIEDVYSKSNDPQQDFHEELTLNSQVLDITLTAPLNYSYGETIKGKVYIKTEPFYHLNRDCEPKQIQVEFDLFFACQLGY